MLFSIHQELYKFLHKKITWISLVVLFALMLMTAATLGYAEGKLVTMVSYDAPDWIMFVLVIVGATLFTMEFQSNSILTLIYKAASKAHVYFSKIIILFGFNVFLHLLAIIFTIIIRWFTPGGVASWSSIYRYNQPLWENMIKASLIDVISSTLIISIIILLSCLFKNNSVVVLTTFLVIFLGRFITGTFSRREILTDVIKWNPFNMINLTNQYYNYGTYHEMSYLDNGQLLIGTVFYTCVFFTMGYLVFRKRHF